MPRLIINADDFGITPDVTDSILACHDAGAVTSTTFMANGSDAERAADAARSRASLSTGLHFNLTEGEPQTDPSRVPTLLTSSGSFVGRGELVRRWMQGHLAPEEVWLELQSQLARMRRLGLEPSHLDSHQHVHALIPTVAYAVRRVASSLGRPARTPWTWRGARPRSVKRRLTQTALSFANRMWSASIPIPSTNDGFCSVFDLDCPPSSIELGSYEQLLAPYVDLRGTVELMVHPGGAKGGPGTSLSFSAVSAAEHTVLRTGELRSLATSMGFELTNYWTL